MIAARVYWETFDFVHRPYLRCGAQGSAYCEGQGTFANRQCGEASSTSGAVAARLRIKRQPAHAGQEGATGCSSERRSGYEGEARSSSGGDGNRFYDIPPYLMQIIQLLSFVSTLSSLNPHIFFPSPAPPSFLLYSPLPLSRSIFLCLVDIYFSPIRSFYLFPINYSLQMSFPFISSSLPSLTHTQPVFTHAAPPHPILAIADGLAATWRTFPCGRRRPKVRGTGAEHCSRV
jgi:hypothetical protein